MRKVGADLALQGHERVEPLPLHWLRHLPRHLVRRGAVHVGVGEAPYPVEPRLAQELQQLFELRVRLARKADDERAAQGDVGHRLAPAPDALEGPLRGRGAAHAAQHRRRSMLQRHVEIGQQGTIGHQREQLVDVRIGIDVVQPHPLEQLPQALAQRDQIGWQRLPAPLVAAVAEVHAIGGRVLGDDQEFLHAGFRQRLRLTQHLTHRPRCQLAAQARNHAEGAAVVAALGDLEVSVMARRQLHAVGGQRGTVARQRRRQRPPHRRGDRFRRMGARHRQHLGMRPPHHIRLGAEAAGDDHAARFTQRFADGVQGFLDGAVDEAAGVHHHHIRGVIARRGVEALRLQPRDDALRVRERLRAAQADEADPFAPRQPHHVRRPPKRAPSISLNTHPCG